MIVFNSQWCLENGLSLVNIIASSMFSEHYVFINQRSAVLSFKFISLYVGDQNAYYITPS